MNFRNFTTQPSYFTAVVVLVMLSLTIFSCQNDDDNIMTIDDELSDVLVEKANGQGLSFFQMPKSDDLNRIPQDPNNQLTPDKVALGKLLFHETGLSTKPKVTEGVLTYSCASCHHAGGGFQACLPQGIGEGGAGYGYRGESRHLDENLYQETEIDVQPIRTPSAMNGAYQSVTLWNGQFGASDLNAGTEDNWTAGTPKETNHLGYLGLETQAIAGLGVHRMEFDENLAEELGYKSMFDQVFADFPSDERYSLETAGLAIAAFERTIFSNEAPFQQWLGGRHSAMTEQEKRGAILFFDKANCVDCHTGPALNSDAFNAIGLNDLVGDHIFQSDPDSEAHLGRGGFTGRADDMYQFKVPQLYNMKDSPFFGHGASFTTLRAIVEYKNNAIKQNGRVPDQALDPGFSPLGLSDSEIDDIVAFLENGLYDANLFRYQPSSVLSGQCIPNNDTESQEQLGCL